MRAGLLQGQALGLVVAARRELERLGVSISQGKVSEVGVAGPPDPRGPDLGKVIKVEGPSGSVERRRADLVLWTAGARSHGSPRDRMRLRCCTTSARVIDLRPTPATCILQLQSSRDFFFECHYLRGFRRIHRLKRIQPAHVRGRPVVSRRRRSRHVFSPTRRPKAEQ